MASPSPLTLSDVAGDAVRFSGRASDHASRWLQKDLLIRDAIACGSAPLLGRVPVLIAAPTATPRVRRFFERAAMPFPEQVTTFTSGADYPGSLRSFSEPGHLLVQHVHTAEELPPERYEVPPDVLSRLNDKGRLTDFAPPENVPRRETAPVGRLLEARCALPCVVKVATWESSGGGHGVAICHSVADLRTAYERFRDAGSVVIEELLDIEESHCLNFAAFADGTVRYLGAAEQVSMPNGIFAGNWLDSRPPSAEAISVARSVAEKGAAAGYVGFLGIDIVISGGHSFVVDLNFRLNASTVAVVLREAIRQAYGDVVIRSKRWLVTHDDWERRVADGIDAQRIIPICIYDPDGSAYPDRPPLVLAMILGSSRKDVEEFERRV